jgi:MoaA/NifB/PqqE/SkfB family radical SAM enzyme
MYKLEDIKDVHLELTSKCQARCPMCPRRINGGILNPLITLVEIDLPTFKQWFPLDFLKQLKTFFMCGNLGDPIIAQDTLEIFQYIREVNPNIHLSMHTNGSARTVEWWKELAKLNIRIVFGIDGMSDTHHLYRIGTDWHKIIKNCEAFINAGGWAEWHMLVFKHNEHQVNECEELSKIIGFKSFNTKHTSRFTDTKFNVIDDEGKTTHLLEPTERSINMIAKNKDAIQTVNPTITCKAKNASSIYISADGNINPCCWLDFKWILPRQDSRLDYMDVVGVFPNLNKQSITEIFESDHFQKIEDTWAIKPLIECSKQCGKFDKLGAQFEN